MSVESLSGPDYTSQLKQLMQQVGLPSFAALSRATGLSRSQMSWLRQGRILHLRLGQVLQLSQTLEVSLSVLLTTFESVPSKQLLTQAERDSLDHNCSANSLSESVSQPMDLQQAQLQRTLDTLTSEYQRLQTQHQSQQDQLWQEYQRTTLQTLESLVLQWPTAVYAARKNPEAPAVKILPLLRPLEQLLLSWGIIAIGEVGAIISYDPQWHQLMPVGTQDTQPGDRVRVRYVGYRQGEQLLYRAKVSPTEESA